MTTRRRFLAGVGTAAAVTLAGCSSLGGPEERERDEIDPEAFEGEIGALTWPASPLPVHLPESLVATHRTRATELYASVPADPSIPNEVVAERLDEERGHLETRLDEESDAGPALEALDDWRYTRGSAANLAGAYRAATGEDDGADVRDRRRTIRADLGDFVADLEYRAADPIEAVQIYATVEDLLGDVRRRVRPVHPYPDSPTAAVEQAGDAVEDVEDAAASLADAREIRDTYLADRESVTSQWSRLIDGSRSMDYALGRTRETAGEFLQEPDPGSVFDRDLTRLAERLYMTASRRVDAGSGGPGEFERRGHGEYATAILDATRELAAIAVLRNVVDGIESGQFADDVTAQSVIDAADEARSAVDALADATDPTLAVAVARPGFGAYQGGRRDLEDHFLAPADAQAAFRYTAMYARVAPEAAGYLVDRLAS
ncbi:MAG: hypothetical protein ACOCS7_02225, partial [Halolamina sp.]